MSYRLLSVSTGDIMPTVAKVWIEEDCITCDACQDILPEVFEVTDDTSKSRLKSGKTALLIETLVTPQSKQNLGQNIVN